MYSRIRDFFTFDETDVVNQIPELLTHPIVEQSPLHTRDALYAPRSGLALNHHIHVGGGVIDQDYRGNVGVIIYNHSDAPFIITSGDRIAQLICEKSLIQLYSKCKL